MTKLLLVDCDGTIREPLSGAKFISHPKDQRIIDGALPAIAHYHEQGWAIIGISNQAGIAAGYKTLEDALKEQQYTLELCPEIAGIIFCPDFEGQERVTVFRPGVLNHSGVDENELHNSLKGTYRKPNPGMLLWAMAWLGVEKTDCFYVGDREEDKAAALSARIKFRWAEDWRNPFLF